VVAACRSPIPPLGCVFSFFLSGEEIRAPSFLNLKFTVSVCMGEKWDRPYSRSKAAA